MGISKYILSAPSRYVFLGVTFISLTLNLTLHSSVRDAISTGYPGDSFHTLTSPASIGLAMLSISLIMLLLAASWSASAQWIAACGPRSKINISFYFLLDLLITLLLYAILLTLVPQIYYAYYHLIFANLPQQWVIKPLPPGTFFRLIQLRAGGSTSEHLAGLTGWIVVCNLVMHWYWKLKLKHRTIE